MATLTQRYEALAGVPVGAEAMGGVAAVKRVRADEPFDAVVLAAGVIDELIADGKIVAGSRVDLVRSGVSVAVKAGAPKVDVSSEEAVKRAVLAARTIGYSTGPSGVYLAQLFERWGIMPQIKDRLVQAQPGVSVGSLISGGQVELGFQQYSELIHLQGIDILGPLPDAIQTITIFSAGIATTSQQPEAVKAVLAYMASEETRQAKIDNGMDAA
jgi:molybdate transport system substrate-binding protein